MKNIAIPQDFLLAFGLIMSMLLFAAILLTPQQSFAKDDAVLSDKRIKSFIKQSSKLTSTSNKTASAKEIKKFLKMHLHDDARFKSTMKYTIPGYPQQKNVIAVDKKKYIASILSAPDAVSDYDHNIKIENIHISTDGRKATVKTKSKETGTMKVSETQEVPIEGVSKCNQILTLDKKNIIQMFSAQCVTDVVFLDF